MTGLAGQRGRRILAAVAAVAAVAAGAGVVWAGAPGDTASAAPKPLVGYDALGDSYASGYGVPPYTECGRSAAAYAAQLDGRMRIALDDFAACAGATTASLVSGGQLDALDADSDLVTLSVGGNDVGWSNAVGACLVGSDQQCAGAIAASVAKAEGQLAAALDALYGQIADRAADAHVVVTGYPHLFTPEAGAFLAASPADQGKLNDAADALNAVLAGAAESHGFEFVDVTDRFEGHGANSAEPWLLGPFDPGAFHPNAAGYGAYTAAVTAAIQPSELR